GTTPDDPTFRFAAARVPRYRIELQAATDDPVVTPSERFALGLAALQGDEYGPSDLSLLSPSARDELLATAAAATTELRFIGAATPDVGGKAAPWVGTWTPYEAIERESRVDALAERELVDLRLTIIEFLAAYDLPGEVGADLEMYLLGRAPRELRLEDEDDWQSVIAWLGELDDDYFGQGMRWCLKRGYYRVQDF
ncbi:MAG: hypothetical protein R3344_07985, partial [Acidobacteriota bacterium]|nr:hypothetical protein [Acidobacteriota bacterium]